MQRGACLGDETIAAMLEGGLTDEHARMARAHLGTCDTCRRLVSAAIDANVPASASQHARTLAGGVAPGAIVAGRYRIERELGEGGGGRVFVAWQLGLERPVALKILRSELAQDAMALKRFEREARLVASLISDHVVRVHDIGELPTGEPYLVMELLDGEDLGTIVERGPVPVDQAIAWIVAACDALGEAHALGIVHRDVKPSNLFVTRQGRLKVLDFGLAKLATVPSASMTGHGVVLGSPRYMAPEQIVGARDVDFRADVWSLGATLYHLLTGRPPFPEPSLDAVFAAILVGKTPSLAGIRPDLARVLERALARTPAERFASVGELAAALRPRAKRSVRGWLLGIGAVGVVALAAGAIAANAGSTERVTASAAPPAVAIDAGSDPWVATVPSPAPPPVPHGVGPLGNIDGTRVEARLGKLGWKVKRVEHNSFPGCEHTRFLIDKGQTINADVYLLECDTALSATSEGARFRHNFSKSWVIDDGTRVLAAFLGDEHASKQLADALISP